ncbi:ABC transporter permease [Xanthocytophaga agilis]|uniref:Transport permease protein n=1 Tax=Xanthocytophaga agilis TaxID=3048010 RepID=A0AAE3QW87_9BACT|nr:ABC transporter permease [Xanthocytophaga agilis]MDJ1499214.1 ABC transporter permease [Xanthocytophaga agilis]
MRKILFIVEKEFKQIFRNVVLLRMMMIAPVMQLVLLSLAANFEVKNLKIAVVDQDHSTFSRRLVSKFQYIDNFKLTGFSPSYKLAEEQLLLDKIDIVLVIPAHFERDLYRDNRSGVQLMVNAIDGSKAGIASGYASTIIQDFNGDIRIENVPVRKGEVQQVDIVNQYWYNPRLEYRTFMVPGILFELLLLVGGLIAALNIVREKEMGTMEQLNVTPIQKYEFILGKLIPFVVIGLVQFTLGLIVAKFIFRVPMEGSLLLLYVFALLFLILCVGLGLLISTISDTMQQAMFVAFFMLVLFILLSGLFSPTENMPQWAQWLDTINPLKYIIEVARNTMLKGSTFADVRSHFFALLAIALAINGLAIWRYRKTV